MIFLFILLLYSATLFRMSVPLTGDQKVYLSIALEMKEKGSFLIPYLFDRANFLKPPFQYWMTLLGWKIFGLSLFGAIFPSVLALVLSAFLVKRISPNQSNLSALVFSSTLATMTYGTTAQMEIWIVAFYLGAWFFYLDRRLVLTFVTVGVMAWIKGPLYPALFVFSIVLKEVLAKNWQAILARKFLMSLLMGIGIGLLWYFVAAASHYGELRNVFLGRENLGKMQTSQGSPLGMWSEFLGTLFPIIFLAVASMGDPKIRSRLQSEKSFWLAYAAIPAFFFTVFPYRVNTYLYLLTPLVAWVVFEKPEPPKWLRRCIFYFTVIFALVALVLLFRLSAGAWISPTLACALGIAILVWSYSHFQLRGTWIGVSSLFLVCLIRFAATDIGEWDLKPLRSVQAAEMAYLIEPEKEDIWHEFGLVSTALGQPVHRLRDETEEKNFLIQGGTIILSDEQTNSIGAVCEPWRRLKRRLKFPIKRLLLEGLSIEDPELHRIFKICRSAK